MKTILHVIPSLTGGGAERQLALLAAEQGRRGGHVHVALRRRGPYERHLQGSGVVIHALGDLRRGHPLLFTRLHSIVRRVQPDVVQTWTLQMDIIGGVIALAAGVPWVMTERCSKEAYEEMPVSAWLRRRLGRHARAVVANSRNGARYWAELLRSERIARVDNAIDLEMIRSAREVTTEVPVLLWAGRLVPQKAPEILIEALGLLPRDLRVQATLLGDGPLRPVLETMIAAKGLERHVRLLPFQDDWWGRLKGAAAVVSTSQFEGQPNVVLEAMAARCPLVVTDIPQHREFLDEQSALFVGKNDPAALSRAIAQLFASPVAARERAERATLRVTRSTVALAADAYEDVYRCLQRAR